MDYYLTQERLEELKAELDNLKNTRRAEVADRLKRAKELGDLSENSEYIEAREEQAHVEARIFELEEMVKNARVIQRPVNADKVQMGSIVEVERGGNNFKFTIVGSNEARPEAGLISNESPLGRAFFGRKAGEEVKVKTPAGEAAYKIVKIS